MEEHVNEFIPCINSFTTTTIRATGPRTPAFVLSNQKVTTKDQHSKRCLRNLIGKRDERLKNLVSFVIFCRWKFDTYQLVWYQIFVQDTLLSSLQWPKSLQRSKFNFCQRLRTEESVLTYFMSCQNKCKAWTLRMILTQCFNNNFFGRSQQTTPKDLVASSECRKTKWTRFVSFPSSCGFSVYGLTKKCRPIFSTSGDGGLKLFSNNTRYQFSRAYNYFFEIRLVLCFVCSMRMGRSL